VKAYVDADRNNPLKEIKGTQTEIFEKENTEI
jgi:hypothetical protein